MDNKTVQDAIATIGLSKEKVTMVIKKQDGGTVTIPAPQPPPVAPVVVKASPRASRARDSSSERELMNKAWFQTVAEQFEK